MKGKLEEGEFPLKKIRGIEATCFSRRKGSHCSFGVMFNLQHMFRIDKWTMRMTESVVSSRNQNGGNDVVQYPHHSCECFTSQCIGFSNM